MMLSLSVTIDLVSLESCVDSEQVVTSIRLLLLTLWAREVSETTQTGQVSPGATKSHLSGRGFLWSHIPWVTGFL
jgi:hypothetical protein